MMLMNLDDEFRGQSGAFCIQFDKKTAGLGHDMSDLLVLKEISIQT